MEKEELNRLLSLMFQAHPWHGVTPGENAPRMVRTYVEIVPRDVVKYERLQDDGWRVIRFTSDDLSTFERRRESVERVRRWLSAPAA